MLLGLGSSFPVQLQMGRKALLKYSVSQGRNLPSLRPAISLEKRQGRF
jgi:hypothetical protein